MILRAFTQRDVETIVALHDKHFKNEFELPEFDKFVSCIAAEDDGELIAAGGIRTISELVIIPDMSKSLFKRKRAYLSLLQVGKELSRSYGYDQLHAFVQGDRWTQALKHFGFTDCKGKALVMGLNNG